jgi:hypothetical protein
MKEWIELMPTEKYMFGRISNLKKEMVKRLHNFTCDERFSDEVPNQGDEVDILQDDPHRFNGCSC